MQGPTYQNMWKNFDFRFKLQRSVWRNRRQLSKFKTVRQSQKSFTASVENRQKQCKCELSFRICLFMHRRMGKIRKPTRKSRHFIPKSSGNFEMSRMEHVSQLWKEKRNYFTWKILIPGSKWCANSKRPWSLLLKWKKLRQSIPLVQKKLANWPLKPKSKRMSKRRKILPKRIR